MFSSKYFHKHGLKSYIIDHVYIYYTGYQTDLKKSGNNLYYKNNMRGSFSSHLVLLNKCQLLGLFLSTLLLVNFNIPILILHIYLRELSVIYFVYFSLWIFIFEILIYRCSLYTKKTVFCYVSVIFFFFCFLHFCTFFYLY